MRQLVIIGTFSLISNISNTVEYWGAAGRWNARKNINTSVKMEFFLNKTSEQNEFQA